MTLPLMPIIKVEDARSNVDPPRPDWLVALALEIVWKSAEVELHAQGDHGSEQPNPGRGAAPGQHVSHPYGPKRHGGELNWTENTTT